ncbi:MAG: polyhydroxyalkanoate depolymerase [Betaproteobacteria bacterium]|jgi:poly(3-hydroxybutyrate) depolymerase
MLYQVYETQRSLFEPFAEFAQAAAKLYNNPISPFSQTALAHRISATYDLIYRLGKDYEKPQFGIQSVQVLGADVAIQERVEINKPFCELKRFKRYTSDIEALKHLKQQPVVLLVAPLSGHYATLLRDTVKNLLADHKVYITDWKNARMISLSEGEFHLDDYVNYIQEFLKHLQNQYGNCHVISVCQPTVPVLAAVSLMASRGELTPYSMTMMGGPIDASRSPTAVNNLAMNKSYGWFENNVIFRVPLNFPGAGRRVYPGFLQHAGFVAMNPERHLKSHYDFFKDLIKGDNSNADNHRTFYDEYNAVLDMDADYYLETIKVVFQDMRLVKGTWDVKSLDGKMERVRPQDIKGTALLTIEGELDDISGSGQTQAAQGLCTGIKPSQLKHLEVPGAGHYGIFSGRRWREVVYPNVREFILSHQPSLSDSLKADKLKAASIKKDPKKAAPRSKPIAASSAASKRNNKRASSI